jgi:hypothetical protein
MCMCKSSSLSKTIPQTYRFSSENKTRIIKMISIDGEYMLLGRRNVDISNVFVQYGQGTTRTANFTGGPGVQETEFVDGLRLSVISAQPFRLNAELKFGVPPGMVPAGMTSLCKFLLIFAHAWRKGFANLWIDPYTWVVNTTNARNASLTKADVIFPINEALVNSRGNNSANVRVVPAKRALDAVKTKGFSLLENSVSSTFNVLADPSGTKIHAVGMQSLDGEYILLVDGAAKGNEVEAEGKIGREPLES